MPRQELRQHRTGLALCGAEQLRARKRGLRQADEPAGFLDAVAAALLTPAPIVRRGDDLAGAAICERHRCCELDPVAFLVIFSPTDILDELVGLLRVCASLLNYFCD